MMIYYVYILQSVQNGQFYIGQTQNLLKRISEHNLGKSTFTRKNRPWNLIWFTRLETRSEAFNLEQRIKKFKSRERIIKFMEENPAVPGSENLQICNLLDFGEST